MTARIEIQPQTVAVADTPTATRRKARRAIVCLAALAAMISVTVAFVYSQLGEVKYSHASAREFTRQAEFHRLAGDRIGAVAASRAATKEYRGLMRVNPMIYAPYLAASLHDLSVQLSEAGDHAGALLAVEEAIRIRRYLAARYPMRFAAGLERSRELLSQLAAASRGELAHQGNVANSLR
jgi:hypothetical protein